MLLEKAFQKKQRLHNRVTGLSILLEYADEANKKELRRRLRMARGSLEAAVIEHYQILRGSKD